MNLPPDVVQRIGALSWTIQIPKDLCACWFCMKPQKEVKKLIAGAAARICDECIDLCIGIMNSSAADEANSGPAAAIPPLDPSILNPGIRRFVALLREHSFDTTDSGDGETHEHACDRDVGYVVIRVAQPWKLTAEADRLRKLLVDQTIATSLIAGDAPFIQATYDPEDGTAIIELHGVHDRMLPTEAPR